MNKCDDDGTRDVEAIKIGAGAEFYPCSARTAGIWRSFHRAGVYCGISERGLALYMDYVPRFAFLLFGFTAWFFRRELHNIANAAHTRNY